MTLDQDTRLLTTDYPYVLYVWWTDPASHGGGGRRYWKVMARCETLFRASELAGLLSRPYPFVRIDHLEAGHFLPAAFFPNQQVVEQQTVADAYEPRS